MSYTTSTTGSYSQLANFYIDSAPYFTASRVTTYYGIPVYEHKEREDNWRERMDGV